MTQPALAEERLADLIRRALKPRARRIATKPTGAQRERRLSAKRAHSERKAARRVRDDL